MQPILFYYIIWYRDKQNMVIDCPPPPPPPPPPTVTRGGHIYTCCTDTRDRDQSEIKRSSCKIGDDQAIKMSICTAQIKVKMGPVLRLHPHPTHPRLAIKDQGSFSGAIKRSRSKNGPDQILIPVAGVSTAGRVSNQISTTTYNQTPVSQEWKEL